MLLIHGRIQNTQYTILSIVFITRHSSCKYCKIVFYQIYLGGAGIHATRQRRTIPTILSSAHSVTDGFLRRYFTFFVGQYFKRVGDHFTATWFLFWPKALRDLHPIFLFWHSLSLLNNPFLLQKIVSIVSILSCCSAKDQCQWSKKQRQFIVFFSKYSILDLLKIKENNTKEWDFYKALNLDAL